MEQNLILYTIIGMSFITLLIKIIPALLVSNYKIPDFLNKILKRPNYEKPFVILVV